MAVTATARLPLLFGCRSPLLLLLLLAFPIGTWALGESLAGVIDRGLGTAFCWLVGKTKCGLDAADTVVLWDWNPGQAAAKNVGEIRRAGFAWVIA